MRLWEESVLLDVTGTWTFPSCRGGRRWYPLTASVSTPGGATTNYPRTPDAIGRLDGDDFTFEKLTPIQDETALHLATPDRIPTDVSISYIPVPDLLRVVNANITTAGWWFTNRATILAGDPSHLLEEFEHALAITMAREHYNELAARIKAVTHIQPYTFLDLMYYGTPFAIAEGAGLYGGDVYPKGFYREAPAASAIRARAVELGITIHDTSELTILSTLLAQSKYRLMGDGTLRLMFDSNYNHLYELLAVFNPTLTLETPTVFGDETLMPAGATEGEVIDISGGVTTRYWAVFDPPATVPVYDWITVADMRNTAEDFGFPWLTQRAVEPMKAVLYHPAAVTITAGLQIPTVFSHSLLTNAPWTDAQFYRKNTGRLRIIDRLPNAGIDVDVFGATWTRDMSEPQFGLLRVSGGQIPYEPSLYLAPEVAAGAAAPSPPGTAYTEAIFRYETPSIAWVEEYVYLPAVTGWTSDNDTRFWMVAEAAFQWSGELNEFSEDVAELNPAPPGIPALVPIADVLGQVDINAAVAAINDGSVPGSFDGKGAVHMRIMPRVSYKVP
jgi:hypothetical protein